MPIHERSVEIIHRKQLLLRFAARRTVIAAGAVAGALIWALPLMLLLANFGYLYATHWLSGQLHVLAFSSDPLWRQYLTTGWPWLAPAIAVGALHAAAHRHTLRTGYTLHIPLPIFGGRMGLEGVIGWLVVAVACIALWAAGAGYLLILLIAGMSIRIGQAPDALGQLITLAYDTLLLLYGERSARESFRLDLLEPLVKGQIIGWVTDVHIEGQGRDATVLLHPRRPEHVDGVAAKAVATVVARRQAEGLQAPTVRLTTSPPATEGRSRHPGASARSGE